MNGDDRNGSRAKILLVDDDGAGRAALRMLLDDPSYETLEASSGEAALRQCLREEFALILMDVRMPGMDGFEAAGVIRGHPRFRETPIIFLTADPHGDTQRLHGYEVGGVDYLVKPVEPLAMRAKVSVFVALWRRTNEVRRQGERLRELEARELRRELEEQTEVERRRADEQIRLALQHANEELDRRVRERTAELENANREMESFSYSVAHDLRAPLRAMHGFSAILIDACGPQTSPEALDAQSRLLAAVRRMERLIDDLLDLARVSRRAVTRSPVDLAKLANEIVAGLREREPERGVEVVVAPDLVVDADLHLARIVLDNLLGNAWKFSRPRDVARIELGRDSQSPHVLFVRDNGVGFDPAYTTRLFEPFERLHGSQEFEGTGIGLATVRRILHRHGGWIRAEGHPNEGATFTFSFEPRAVSEAGA